MCNLCFLDIFVPAKTTPRVGRTQNGKPAAAKQPPKRDMKNFKNVDSKLANLIMNDIVDRYLEAITTPVNVAVSGIQIHKTYSNFLCCLQWHVCVL